MTAAKDIPWFNPRQMSSETVLRLSTGREELLHDFYLLVRQRHREPAAGRHWLVTGPRGAGKSFFLCLVQAMWPKVMTESAAFVLLPEELPNVYAPHEWLREVERLLPGKPRSKGSSPSWQTSEKDEAAAWETALKSLLEAFTGTLLVIGVENFDMLLQQAFDSPVRASRLRSLMENEPRIMLLATAVEGEFDEAYEKRLFRQFEHHPMPRWNELDHRHYLTRRAELVGKVPTQRQLARIDAYSRFTGGSARVAAVLASAILDEQDPVSASADLTATLDRMSDYYRSLIERLPANTSKVFDALIRGGEPASQVELAARVHARQNDISRAFRWLVDYGYVVNERRPGSKEHSYRVTDRLFVQFYRMRYVDPDQPCQLAILADLLATSIEFRHKWHFAEGYLGSAKPAEAEFMAKLACSERGVDVKLLPESMRDAESLVNLGREWLWMDQFSFEDTTSHADFVRRCLERFNSEEEIKQAYDKARKLALALEYEGLRGAELVELIERNRLLAPLNKYMGLVLISSGKVTHEKWAAVKKTCEAGLAEEAEMIAQRPQMADHLRFRDKAAESYPLASSLTDIVRQYFSGKSANEFDLKEVTCWSSHAVILWTAHEQHAEASELIKYAFQGAKRLVYEFGESEAVVNCLEPFGEIESKLTTEACEVLHTIQGDALFEMDEFSRAFEILSRARNERIEIGHAEAATLTQLRMSICLIEMGRIGEALNALKVCISEAKIFKSAPTEVLALGQTARALQFGHEWVPIWHLFGELSVPNNWNKRMVIQQASLAVLDKCRSNGLSAGFSFGKRLLTETSVNAPEVFVSAVPAMWVEMVNSGVPVSLLRDLLAEVPNSEQTTAVRKALGKWMDLLEQLHLKKQEPPSNIEPDVNVAIHALNRSLTPKAKKRLGLIARKQAP